MKHPWQLWLVDPEGVRPTRKWAVRPGRIVAALIVLATFAFALGVFVGHRISDANALAYRLARAEHEAHTLKRELAAWQAKAEVKQRATEAMQREIARLEGEIADLQAKLTLYERILDARKGKGVEIVDLSAEPVGASWRWRAILVKGGNYPRWVRGRLEIAARDADGVWQTITPEGGLRFKMETHTVLAGEWTPPADKEPVALRALARDPLGRVIAEARKTIGGEDHVRQAEAHPTGKGAGHGD